MPDFFKVKWRKLTGKLTAVLMACIMCLSPVVSLTQTVYAEDLTASNVSVDDMKKSIEKVIASVDELKDLIKPEDVDEIEEIFKGFIGTAVSVGGTAIDVINGATTFLKLIGVMKDANMQALADITEQLKIVNEKLDIMDKKLNDLTDQMKQMSARSEFNIRTQNAILMEEAWSKFETHYMEEQMDELMRQHKALMLDEIEKWVEFSTPDVRPSEGANPHTDKVVLLYPADNHFGVRHTLENSLAGKVESADQYLILDQTFLPGKGEMAWNVNTYRQSLVGYLQNKLLTLRNNLRDSVITEVPDTVETPETSGLYEKEEPVETPVIAAAEFSIGAELTEEPAGDSITEEPAEDSITEEPAEDSITEEPVQAPVMEISPAAAAEAAAPGESSEAAHYETFNMDPAAWTDEDVARYANDGADAIIYRLNWYAVNKSADFSTKVQKQFVEYCNHLLPAQEGMSAMLKAIYLTHAFEFETADDIKDFCNQMILKTGVYGMFATNILGLSKYISEKEKLDTAAVMCSAIDGARGLLDNSIMGDGRYCYVTNSLVEYGEVTFKGKVSVNYSKRGHVTTYESCSGGNITAEYTYEDMRADTAPNYIGDESAMIIAYYVASKGNVLDHDFMKEHLTRREEYGMDPVTKRSAVLSSIASAQLPIDASCRMSAYNVLGGWFPTKGAYYMNGLPKSCTTGYLQYRRAIKGTTVDGGSLSVQTDRTLAGVAVYGESHWYWEQDESAILGGPVNDASFSEKFSSGRTGSDFFRDYYRADYSNQVTYNCLLQVPKHVLKVAPGPYPLESLAEYTDVFSDRTDLSNQIREAEAAIADGEWTKKSLTVVQTALQEANEIIAREDATQEEIRKAGQTLAEAVFGLKQKSQQKMTVSAKAQTVKASVLAKKKQVLAPLTVTNAKGTVRYAITSVTAKKYSSFFTIAAKTGKLTVKKGLPKGNYTLKVKVTAAGTGTYKPAEKTVSVKITVK